MVTTSNPTSTNTILSTDTPNRMNNQSQTTANTDQPMITSNLANLPSSMNMMAMPAPMMTMAMETMTTDMMMTMMIPLLTQPFHCHLKMLDHFHCNLQELHRSFQQFTKLMQMTLMPMTTAPLLVLMLMKTMTTLMTTIPLAHTPELMTNLSTPTLPTDRSIKIPPAPLDNAPFVQSTCDLPTYSPPIKTITVVPKLTHQRLPKPNKSQPHHQPSLPSIRCKPNPSHSFLSALTHMAKNNYRLP